MTHPLEDAGCGPAPYKMFVVVRGLPDPGALKFARINRVDPSRCRCCRMPAEDLYVVECRDGARAGLCRPCVEVSGDGGLIKRARHEDHERDRMMRRIAKR